MSEARTMVLKFVGASVDAPHPADQAKAAGSDKPRVWGFVASTKKVDRAKDEVGQDWNLDGWRKNPIILLNHEDRELPIGKGQARVVDGELRLDVVFDQSDPRAREVERKLEGGFLNAVSVRFIPGTIEPNKRRGQVRPARTIGSIDRNAAM